MAARSPSTTISSIVVTRSGKADRVAMIDALNSVEILVGVGASDPAVIGAQQLVERIDLASVPCRVPRLLDLGATVIVVGHALSSFTSG